MTRLRQAIAPILGLVFALAAASVISAQPATPPIVDGPTGVLAEFALDTLPTPHTELWLIRYGMGPGSSLPDMRQAGPVVIVAESGEAVLSTDQPVQVSGGAEGGGSAAATPASGGTIETRLAAHQAALVQDGTTLAIRNEGDVDASILTLSMYAAARESEMQSGAEPEGAVTSQMLAVTVADLANGPGTVVIERVASDPGATEDVSLPGGGEVGVLERGGASLEIAQGQGFVWPQSVTTDPNVTPKREPIRAGSSVDLTAGDGYGYSDVTGTWTVPESGDGVTILRARVIPTGE